jgi:hypothetical protein
MPLLMSLLQLLLLLLLLQTLWPRCQSAAT